ncbi:hypothetical protein [Agromyces ramosus]|uniref:Uncharacterized protein n=1 Tax=Agromyces ramosus TaxID=33879 RepID=A0ABU0RA93_9MICO|nr:hypothetical protein [Agromyces ramosus]MDQ0893964.1 hypothetical protein [Agromyces ramosus]
MAGVEGEERPVEPEAQPEVEPGEPGEPDEAAKPEPPYQALFPNLDRVSRSSFDQGTVSRRRINRALAVLAVVAVLVVLAVVLIPVLTR